MVSKGDSLGPEFDGSYVLPVQPRPDSNHQPRIPRQIIAAYYGLRYGVLETVRPSEYAGVEKLAQEGRALRKEQADLQGLCLEGSKDKEFSQVWYVELYSELRPASLFR